VNITVAIKNGLEYVKVKYKPDKRIIIDIDNFTLIEFALFFSTPSTFRSRLLMVNLRILPKYRAMIKHDIIGIKCLKIFVKYEIPPL
jgi:hypothetical protein